MTVGQSLRVKWRTIRCTSPVYVVSQSKLGINWELQKRGTAWAHGSGRTFITYYM